MVGAAAAMAKEADLGRTMATVADRGPWPRKERAQDRSASIGHRGARVSLSRSYGSFREGGNTATLPTLNLEGSGLVLNLN